MNTILLNSPVLAHFLIGFYFAFYGFWNIRYWAPILQVMADKNVPHPYLILPIGIGWQIITGCMIIFGIYVKLAALLLIPFTILAACIFYPYWNFKGEHRKTAFGLFFTHMTITLGALLSLITPITGIIDLVSQ